MIPNSQSPPLRRVFVVGVGMTKFMKPGVENSRDYPDLAKEAGQKALADAQIPYSAVEQACIGYVYGDSTCGQRAIYHSLGLTGIPIINVNNNCSTGSTALFMARQIIQGGIANCVLALGFEKMEKGSLGVKSLNRTNPMDKHLEVMVNKYELSPQPIAAQLFGNAGKEHMEKYGTKVEHFAKIGWKNHKHSINNPYSQFQKEYSLDEVMTSREVFDFLTVLQCCPTSDGAAAAILASEEFVQKFGLHSKAVEILAQEMMTDLPSSFEEKSIIKMVGFDMSKEAARKCYEKSGLGPGDIDVIELHDCFSSNELLTYEALGLCPEGEGGKLVDRGDNTYGGKWVINPSGGLISKGHPLGATGLAQCAELCWQLRGEAGKRQVPGAKVALQHNLGLGGAAVVTLYKMGFPEAARTYQIEAAPTSSAADGFKASLVFKEIEKKLEEEGEQFVKKIGGIFAFKVKDGPGGKEATWVVDVKNGKGSVHPNSGTMARSKALLLLLLLPSQLQLGPALAVRAPVFGRNGAHSLSPEENEFVEEEPVLVLSPEQPGPGPATINCPRDCACSQEGVVDCGGIDLREFPGDLPEHTNHLSLQNNQLEKIYPQELSRLHQLETLNLQNNRLTSRGLPEEAFEHLTNLNYLYLANNKLTLAPRFLPNTLISVDFAANYLTKIYGLTFGQKPNLRSVYLHNNKLADAGLPDNMFNGSSNVEILILSSNFLRHVPKHLPPALYKLHLKNNKLEKIPPGAFSELSNLRELYLQNNYLTDEGLDNETFWKLSSLEYLDLSSNNLSRVPAGLPRSLVLLHLEKNAIRSVDADVLTPIRSLEYLLLHSNQLRAHGIHPRAFQGLKRLHTVHLYNNALERVPSSLPRRVRTLMILHNQIAGIGRDDFATTYFLEELNLSYNRITSPQVHRDAFRKLRLLRSLDLSGNRLHTLPPGLPRNVHVLKVKRNELAALARGALAGMAQLRELYLTGNRLRSRALGPRAWADLAHLQLLDIAGNQLTEIPEGLPESLEYLYLQNNKISTVPANAFDSTPNLKGIFLRFNKLAVGSVVESAFRKLKHLQVLDIEGNFEFGDVSKDRGKLEEEEDDEEEEDEEDEERR